MKTKILRKRRIEATMRDLAVCSFLLGLVLPCGVDRAAAQTNLETNAAIQFNFSTPGAANLALGGAFIGLASDATAAYTNPAGLTQLLDAEVHVEIRSWDYTHVFTDRGRLDGLQPTGIGLDIVAGLQDGEADDRVTGVSFFSYVHPLKRRPWSFAVYRHELANFGANFKTQGAFLELTRARSLLGIPGERDGRLASLRNDMDLEIVNLGVSAARRFGDNFSIGLGLSYYDFSLDSLAERFTPPTFEPANFEKPPVNFQTQQGDDTDLGINLGLLWVHSSDLWSFGAVYRQGPDFDFKAESRQGEGTVLDLPFPESSKPSQFHVPDVFGVGLALAPRDTVRVTLDYDRVEYSDLMEDFIDIFELGNFFPALNPELDQFRIDDADEIHLGFEYIFLNSQIAVRFGTWYDPDHSLRFKGTNASFRAIFPGRSNELHYSVGVGVIRRKMQFDAAFDYSDRVSTASISLVRRFGR